MLFATDLEPWITILNPLKPTITVNYNVDILNTTDDPDVEFRAHVRDRNAGQFLVGNTVPVAVGPPTDADARQAADPNVGHLAAGFAPQGNPAATPPSVAYEVSTDRHGTTLLPRLGNPRPR